MEERLFICEKCRFRSDKQKKCCGIKMIPIEQATKTFCNPCGCH